VLTVEGQHASLSGDDELTTAAAREGQKSTASRYKTRQSRTHNRPRHC
jgi:hypothetical protein